MKPTKTIILPLVLLTTIGCGVERPSSSSVYPKTKGVTRLVQYNVGVFSKEIDNSIPMVAAMMKEIGADAISLNELDSCNTRHSGNQIADLATDLGNWNWRYSRAMAYREGAYGVGIVTPDEVKDFFSVALPKGEGTEPRACSVVETRDYVLASTHLDYKHEPSMVVQARTISKALVTRYKDSKKPVFLAGDMNSTVESKVLEELSMDWEVLTVDKATYPSDAPKVRIDFILALKNKARFKLKGSDVLSVFNSGDVKVASDHMPLYVDVKL